MTLIHEARFDSPTLPVGWNAYDSQRVDDSNVSIEEGILNLRTTEVPGRGWCGASVVYETPLVYGRFVARVRVDEAWFTKALLMLWPEGDWPPEIDFLEMGGTDNHDRHRNNVTVHYGADDLMVHRSYLADMTRWHTVAVEWRPNTITFRLDGEIQPNVWGSLSTKVSNPGVHDPMKLHMTYWPHHKLASDPWPVLPSAMQVEWVRIFS